MGILWDNATLESFTSILTNICWWCLADAKDTNFASKFYSLKSVESLFVEVIWQRYKYYSDSFKYPVAISQHLTLSGTRTATSEPSRLTPVLITIRSEYGGVDSRGFEYLCCFLRSICYKRWCVRREAGRGGPVLGARCSPSEHSSRLY